MSKRAAGKDLVTDVAKKIKVDGIKEKPEGTITIASWNVGKENRFITGGLNACLKKGFQDYIDKEKPEMILLQECKLNQDLAYLSKQTYPYQYQSHCKVKKGYSGVAVHSKIKPLSVSYEVGDKEMDKEGRYIILEFENYYLINSYIINAGAKLARLEEKRVHYKNHLIPFLKSLKKPVIFGGDLNVCHKEIDLARPDSNHRTAGFTDEEREDFSTMLKECNLVDTYRALHPAAKDKYSYYSYRFNCYSKNLGWRLDYFLVSQSLFAHVKESDIRTDLHGASDHVPLYIAIDSKINEK